MSAAPEKKLTIFITVDTEDSYFDVPRLITGEGLDNTPGIFKILDITEKYGFRSNIFLDVYNHINFQPGVLQSIAQSIYNRGHAIELHSHPTGGLSFYKENIYNYSLEKQIKILKYGKQLIYEWTGINPVAHRGGSYAINELTLSALHTLDIPMDSTLFFNHSNNKLQERSTINKVSSYSQTLEIPVTYVKVMKKNGEYLNSKFDLDALSYNELVKVIELAKENDLRILTLFLHSFSFIQKKSKRITEENDPSAIFRSPSHGGSLKCEIYGVDQKDLIKYDQLLNYISQDPEIEILTLKRWYKRYKASNIELGTDYVPIIDRS